MKRSTLMRRLMTLAMFSEVIYLLLVTVVFIFRPEFYTKAVGSVFKLNIGELPVNAPDMTLTIFLYGSIAVFFILWFILKVYMDSDSDPLVLGIVTFLMLPATVIVTRYMLHKTLNGMTSLGTNALAFYSMDFTILKYCGWFSIAGFIFMLMGYSVARQRFADLD
ncbi:MAG: hypothetical protein J6I46_14375 [Ruminococcus sp.]|nr:hypothetical protein [Ruminococcus sp.]MBQ1432768.1 hypothetical protein [Ruminococcus sp.]